MGDAAAAGADLDQVDRGHGDGQAAALAEAIAAVNLEQPGDQRRAVLDQAGLGGGAAHVEGHQPVDAEQFGIMAGGERTGSRAALDHPHRVLARRLGPDHAAGGQHDQRRVGEALAAQPVAETLEIGLRDRHRIGVHRRGRGALIFADLRRDLRGGADEDAVELARQGGRDQRFVVRIGEAVQEADRDGMRAAGADLGREPGDVLRARRQRQRAVGEDALLQAEGQLARDQRLGELDLRIVHVVAVLIADREHVTEALGDDERRRQALALDQRVGHDRRGMDHDAVDRVGCDAGLAEHGIDAPEEALQQVVMRRQRLVDAEAAAGIAQDDVGEGAADVDGQRIGHAL